MFQQSFVIFKAFKIKTWMGLLKIQKSFFIIKCTPNIFKKIVSFNILHNKGNMCEPFKFVFTCTLLDFDFQKSLMIKRIYNL